MRSPARRSARFVPGPAPTARPRRWSPAVDGRRPVRPKIADAVKEQALAVRAALESPGLDHGTISVHDKMHAMGLDPVPSVASLARIFRQTGARSLSHGAWGERSEEAITVFDKAVAAHGVPQRLLCDNGAALNPSSPTKIADAVKEKTLVVRAAPQDP